MPLGNARSKSTPSGCSRCGLVWANRDTLPDSQVVVFARDDHFFGVLQWRAHELWALRLGTWMGVANDLRYGSTMCSETFPMPWPTGEEPESDSRIEAIAEATRLDELGRSWLNPKRASEAELKERTLINLYNARPTWLEKAHKRLDELAFAAYVLTPDLSDEVVLRHLLALNLDRAVEGDKRNGRL